MNANDRPIGVFGGTFDPVHYGHLRPLLELQEQLGLAEVRLIPCHIPPHRGIPGATAAERLAMLQLALQEAPGLVIDERELQRDGPSYTVDTLRSLRQELGERQPLVLMMGMDAFLGLPSWYDWQALSALAHIAVAHRPGYRLDEAGVDAELAALLARCRSEDPAELRRTAAGRIIFKSVTQLEISATDIRRRVASGTSIRFLLPEAVRRFIEQQHLYRQEIS